jgi:hypothetical protein
MDATATVQTDGGRRLSQPSPGTPDRVLEEADAGRVGSEGRPFSQSVGASLLVPVAVGGGMVDGRLGGATDP